MALIDIMPRLNIRGLSPYTIPYSILIVGILAKIKGKIIGIISISAIFLKFFQLIWEFTQKNFKKWHLSIKLALLYQ